jgi:hypothetical protein
MTYQRRLWSSRQRWHAGAATALLAAVATMAGSIAASGAPASASPNSNAPVTTAAPVTTTSVPAATTVPAFAGDLNQIKAQAARWIAHRITALTNEIAVVKARTDLGPDGASLVAEMQADISGLQALGVTIAGDTTVQKALQDSSLIFTEFRVYYLMLPVAADVVHVDGVTNVDLPDIAKAVAWIQSQENSSNQGVLAPLVANMQSQAQIASGATSGLSAQLLGFTPAEWDANHGLLNGDVAQIVIADRAVGTADRDAQEASRYLRHHHTSPTTTSTSTTTLPTTTTTLATTTTSTSTTTSTTLPSTTTTTSSRLPAIKAWAAKLIAERVAALYEGIKKVQGDSFLGSDGTALVNEMQADITGLNAVGTKIAGDVTVSEVRADAALIYGFRVYSLVLPVVRDVTYVDWGDNVKLPAVQKQITVVQGQENTRTQPFLAPIVANMQLEVQTATSATNGLSAQLLSYTAAEWTANPHLLGSAQANIYITQKAISAAGKDFTRAERYVRSLHKHHRS